MDIKERLTIQDKQVFENLRVEMLVLENLLNQKRFQAEEHLKSSLQKAGCDFRLYMLTFNFAENRWEAVLRPDALVMPGQLNREQKRHLPKGG